MEGMCVDRMNMTSSSSEKRQHCINYILGIGCNTLSLELFIKLVGVIYHFFWVIYQTMWVLFIKLVGVTCQTFRGYLLVGVIYHFLGVSYQTFWGYLLVGVIYIFFGVSYQAFCMLFIKLLGNYLSNLLGLLIFFLGQTFWCYFVPIVESFDF